MKSGEEFERKKGFYYYGHLQLRQNIGYGN